SSDLRAGAECKTGLNYLSYLSYITDFSQPIEKREQTRKWIYSGGNMVGRGQPEDVPLLKGDSSDDVNIMINRGQRILFGKMQDLKNSEIINLTGMPQFRMIRHMVGEYELTGEDIYKEFEDSVGVIGNFLKREEWYEIPFRALYNKDYPNLLPAGRIISAEGKAWDVTRVIPVCTLTGEVAGIVASMMIDENIEVKDISVKKLQENLTKRGIKLYKNR
ncbi:MAG: FAD-dependent oxidoreductase, partial [Clostridiales bacterium]|nr:FAD-dependent oxidoreductase [Clostridiales bacterium]